MNQNRSLLGHKTRQVHRNFYDSRKLPPGLNLLIFFTVIVIIFNGFFGRTLFGGYSLSAFVTFALTITALLILVNTSLIGIFRSPLMHFRTLKTIHIFGPFLLILMISSIVNPLSIKGLQNVCSFLILISPLVLSLKYSHLIDSRKVMNTISASILIASVFYLVSVATHGFGTPAFASPRAICMLNCLGLSLLFTQRYLNRRLIFTIAFFEYLSCLFSLSRTGIIIATIVIVVLNFSLSDRNFFFKVIRFFFILALVSFFNLDPVIKRFQDVGDRAGIFGYQFNSSGRLVLWRLLFENAQDERLFGHGIGTSADLIRENFFVIAQPHNDFLRIYYDLGLLGLMAFLWMLAMLIRQICTKGIHSYRHALVSILTMLAFMVTDNILIYPFFILPFGLVFGLSETNQNMENFDSYQSNFLVKSRFRASRKLSSYTK